MARKARPTMKRAITILIAVLVVVGLLVAGVGNVSATHNNPNWGDTPGNSDQPDCSIGHINPHDDGETRAAADDCGINRGNA